MAVWLVPAFGLAELCSLVLVWSWFAGTTGPLSAMVLVATLVLGDMAIGLVVLSRSGFFAASKLMDAMKEGDPPGDPLLDVLLTGASAALFFTPGFVSDVMALVLLSGLFRPLLRRSLGRWLVHLIRTGALRIHVSGTFHATGPRPGPVGPDRVDGPRVIVVDRSSDSSGSPPPQSLPRGRPDSKPTDD